jgi:sterol desaturase/sphingolipid hydroxylase (fatty acid hydroxylase superfamily)
LDGGYIQHDQDFNYVSDELLLGLYREITSMCMGLLWLLLVLVVPVIRLTLCVCVCVCVCVCYFLHHTNVTRRGSLKSGIFRPVQCSIQKK